MRKVILKAKAPILFTAAKVADMTTRKELIKLGVIIPTKGKVVA